MSNHPLDADAVELAEALARHGVGVEATHLRMADEWRPAMLDALAAIRKLDLRGVEPDAVFAPIVGATSADTSSGNDG